MGLIAVNRTPVTVEMKTEIPIASTDAPSDTPESENVETAADKTVPATKDSTTASSSADNPAEEEIATPADTAAEQADSIPDTTEVAAPDLPTSENDLTRSKEERKIGEDLDWWNIVKPMFTRQETTLLVEDFETGTTFTLMVSGGTNHGDVEPLTAEDAKIIKQVWGGQWSWTRRPVIVYINEKAIAASMTAQPHAGRDEFEYGETVHNRSGDFGTGYNFDFVKGNGISGHMDLHFKNSTRHNDGKQDSKHQACINIAAGKTN